MKLPIKVNHDSHTPVTVQIAERIRRLIKTGRLSSGTVLPSVRELADDTGVNFTTVSRAYKDLKDEGLILQNKSRRLEVCEDRKPMSEADRARLLKPLLVGVKAQARELRLSDDVLRREVESVLKLWS